MRRWSCALVALAVTGACAAGCAHPRLEVTPGAAHVRGDYLGSCGQVKVFVESLRLEPLRREHGSEVLAQLALINDGPAIARFGLGANRLEANGENVHPVEAHVLALKPGALTRATLTFRTRSLPDEVVTGVIRVEGFLDAPGAPAFPIPFSAVEE